MPNSGTVASGAQATATQYNNLRADVLDPATGHDHTGEADHGAAILPTLFGDGSDGSVTVTSGTFTSGPITNNSLTRDAFFTNLTLNAGATLDPHGFRLFVAGTLTIGVGAILGGVGGNGADGVNSALALGGVAVAGSLPAAGNGGVGADNTSSAARGAGGGGAGGPIVLIVAKFVVNSGTIQANGGNGGNGSTSGGSAYSSNVSAGAGGAPATALGGAGGAGGNGQATGGIGGVPTLPNTPTSGGLHRTALAWLLAGTPYGATSFQMYTGGGGGGGGGQGSSSPPTNAGVGGGGAGGLVVILFHRAAWGVERALGGLRGVTGDVTGAANGAAGTIIKLQV